MTKIIKYSTCYIFVIILCALSASACSSSNASVVTRADINEAYQSWTKAIDTANGDPSKIVALYADNAVLMPMLSDKMLTSKSQITDYFKKFTSYKNITVSTKKFNVQAYGDIAVANGTYTFYYLGKHDKSESVEARFTFVYQKAGGDKWLIVSQHSSVLPDENKIK